MSLWIENCAGCHGPSGRGDGPASGWLEPAPTNLTARRYSMNRLADVLWNGVHGSAMPAWRDQSADNLAALAAIVQGFEPTDDDAAPSTSVLAAGGAVYAEHCAECHGDNGDGDGFAARELPIMPGDFTGEQPTIDESVRVLREGIKGTSMAPWTDRLSDDEIVAVSHYVRAFFVDDAEASR